MGPTLDGRKSTLPSSVFFWCLNGANISPRLHLTPAEREPFVLSQLPHLYFTGEQLAATVRDPDDGPTRAPRNLKAHQMMDDHPGDLARACRSRLPPTPVPSPPSPSCRSTKTNSAQLPEKLSLSLDIDAAGDDED
ncbi:hypothetical protein PCASD_09180 [Puccinia coronata f. sp. avenae]|uniref:Uncharacterized protein n=1 Tax=Puccinia coronata f. sp. avenae TaxID=200324 RepID=A0A2N5TGD0_9BASI|nr:hypothetical protein PCASD_09180 [Puccinia coronata f. sp. avenae]